MLVRYSPSPLRAAIGITFHNWIAIVVFILLGVLASILCMILEWHYMEIQMVPVSILGGALAIFLGFRNNSAYDRWWEARKIWGGIVNYSRTFTMEVLSFASPVHSGGRVSPEVVRSWQLGTIRRHLAWLHGLDMHLRKRFDWDKLDDYVDAEELERIKAAANKPTQLVHRQGQALMEAHEQELIDNFRHMELSRMLEEFYNLQGKAERIKNTVFPYYYNFFTRIFLWIFVICLPFGLVHDMHWGAIPMSVAISFVFFILDKAGNVTENPFEGRASDTPISTIVRAIEIDVLEMLGDQKIPEPRAAKVGRFGVQYMD